MRLIDQQHRVRCVFTRANKGAEEEDFVLGGLNWDVSGKGGGCGAADEVRANRSLVFYWPYRNDGDESLAKSTAYGAHLFRLQGKNPR